MPDYLSRRRISLALGAVWMAGARKDVDVLLSVAAV